MAARKKTGGDDRADDRAAELAEGMRKRVSARAERDDEPEEEEDDERSPPPPRESSADREGVVDLDDEDEDEDDEEERRASRRERRQERSRIREENESLRRELAEMKGQLTAVQQRPVVVQAPQQPQLDENDRALRAVHERSRALSVQFQQAAAKQGGMTAQEREEFERGFDKLEEERQEIIHRKVTSKNGGGQQMDPERMVAMQLQMEFPALYKPENFRHFQWANARYQLELAEGATPSLDLIKKHLRAAMERLDPTLRRRPAPSPERRSRYEGVSARGGASSTRDDGRRIVTLSEAEKKMARARYRGMPDKKAFSLFAKNVLSKRTSRRESA